MPNNEENVTSKFQVDISDLKKNVTEASRQIRLYRAELKNANAGMEKGEETADSLTKKIAAQSKIVETEQKKLQLLKDELAKYDKALKDGTKLIADLTKKHEEAAAAYGKDSEEAKKLAKQLDEARKAQERNVKAADDLRVKIVNQDAAVKNAAASAEKFKDDLKLFQKVSKETGETVIDLSEAEKKLGDEIDKTEKKASGLRTFFEGLAKTAATAAAAIGAAVGTAAVTLAKQTVQSFAELEQNLGGSEAVFGKYADSIQRSAEDAYRAMGTSQSEYLATANKIGALFQGSGIEQQRSVELTTQAMQRAADMASVMGIETADALEAITGAAKGNYTMMDNLGVAMNATTLETYAASQGIKTLWKDMDNAQKAEVAMKYFFENTSQYAGNFEREASSTISGSIGMLTAATETFVAGLGNSEANIIALSQNIVNAFKAVVTNVTPVIRNLVSVLPQAIKPIVNAVGELLPDIISLASGLVTQVASTLTSQLPTLIPVAVDAVTMLADAVLDNVPAITDAAVILLDRLSAAVLNLLPKLVDSAATLTAELIGKIGELIPKIAEHLTDTLPTLIDSLFEALPSIIDAVLTLGEKLADALPEILTAVIAALPNLVQHIADLLVTQTPKIVKSVTQIFTALVQALPQIVQGLVDALPALLTTLTNFIGESAPLVLASVLTIIDALIKAAPQIMSAIYPMIPQIADALVDGFMEFVPMWINTAGTMIGMIAGSLPELMKQIQTAASAIFQTWKTNIFDRAADAFSEIGESVKKWCSQIWEDVKGVFSGVGTFFGGIWDTIKQKFTTIGTKVGQAIGGAFKNAINSVLATVENGLNWVPDAVNSAIDLINALPGVSIGRMSRIALPRLARGGIVSKSTLANVGEAGREAIIPLDRDKAGLKEIASLILAGMNGKPKPSGTSGGGTSGSSGGTVINYTQNNNSPKALSRFEIYRQTKNMLEAVKLQEV